MTRADWDHILKKEVVQTLNDLVMNCRRRFLRSAALLEIYGPAIARLGKFGSREAVYLGPLMPAWNCLCERYLNARYDPQLQLFQDRRSQIEEFQLAWGRFIYWELMPVLTQDDDLVRNVLRALGGLPCKSPEQAADAVYQHLLEITFPTERPPWAAEEIID